MAQEMSRHEIVKEILDLKVESGKPLRQVKVSDDTYSKAKKFVLKAPNVLQDGSHYRFKILYQMPPHGTSIYDVLVNDAGSTSLDNAPAKIDEWRDASKSLVRYTLNLLLAPNRPEFQRLKLSSSYYVYQVSKKLKGAEVILQAMGYEKVGGSREAQELKFTGEVKSDTMAETAADLVILDGELQRIKDLVIFSKSESLPVTLSNILKVRSHPYEVFSKAKHSIRNSLGRDDGHYQRPVPAHQPPQQPLHQPPQQHPRQPPHQQPNRPTDLPRQDVPRDSGHPSQQPYPAYANFNEMQQQFQYGDGEQKNIHGYYNTPKRSNVRDGDYEVIDLPPASTPFSPLDPNNFPEPIVHTQSDLERMNLVETEADLSSIVNARSDFAGYNDPPYYSLATPLDTPTAAKFNQQAEDAWRVPTDNPQSTPPMPNTPPGADLSNEHKPLVQQQPSNPGTVNNTIYNDLTSAPGDRVNNEYSNKQEVDDLAVTQEWLQQNPSTDDGLRDFDNQMNYGQQKDLKKYDKPVGEMKQKAAQLQEQEEDKTLSSSDQSPASDELPTSPTLDPPPSRDESWQRNMASFDNRPSGYKPIAKPRQKIGALTSPLLLDSPSETTAKRHTSPLSSLEQRERENSLQSNSDGFPSFNKDSDTMPSIGRESNASEDYENVSLSSSTNQYESTTFKYDPSDYPPPSAPPHDSLLPMTRKRSVAVSGENPLSPPTSNTATPFQKLTCCKPAPEKQSDTVSKQYLSSMLSDVGSRNRSDSYTDLDRGKRTSEHSETVSSPSNKVIPANVIGTWTCEYCYNIIFEGVVCDVCGGVKPANVGTLV